MLYENSIKKLKVVEYVIVIIVVSFIVKVGYIQMIECATVYQFAMQSWQRSFLVTANRGKIYDVKGKVLASDLTTSS